MKQKSVSKKNGHKSPIKIRLLLICKFKKSFLSSFAVDMRPKGQKPAKKKHAAEKLNSLKTEKAIAEGIKIKLNVKQILVKALKLNCEIELFAKNEKWFDFKIEKKLKQKLLVSF